MIRFYMARPLLNLLLLNKVCCMIQTLLLFQMIRFLNITECFSPLLILSQYELLTNKKMQHKKKSQKRVLSDLIVKEVEYSCLKLL